MDDLVLKFYVWLLKPRYDCGYGRVVGEWESLVNHYDLFLHWLFTAKTGVITACPPGVLT